MGINQGVCVSTVERQQDGQSFEPVDASLGIRRAADVTRLEVTMEQVERWKRVDEGH
jgi:hypothetical protein